MLRLELGRLLAYSHIPRGPVARSRVTRGTITRDHLLWHLERDELLLEIKKSHPAVVPVSFDPLGGMTGRQKILGKEGLDAR